MIEERLALLAGAIALDALLGEPAALWRRTGHPISWIGALIAWLDASLNGESASPGCRKMSGVLALACILAASLSAGLVLTSVFAYLPFGWIGTLLVASVFLAGRSLFDHVAAVRQALPDIANARRQIARIVGRDPESLNEPGICRAAIETTAENFSDGLLAPALWFLALGLPGLLAYKAINTADSMIGHLSPRHSAFGWASARADDLANWLPARIAGALIALAAPLAGGRIGASLKVMLKDAGIHRSPNAGWPEAAMAGALGLALGGPRRYGGAWVEERLLHEDGDAEARAEDIDRALRVMAGASLLLETMILALAALLHFS